MNIKGLTKEQNEIIEKSLTFREEEKTKAVYTYCLQSVIAETINKKYFIIDADGEIRDATYHNLIAFNYETLWIAQ